MSDLPQHLEITVITEWKQLRQTKTEHPNEGGLLRTEKTVRKIAETEKRIIHKSLISEAKEHEGFCLLRISRQEGTNETITVTEPYEEIARRLCQNNQES